MSTSTPLHCWRCLVFPDGGVQAHAVTFHQGTALCRPHALDVQDEIEVAEREREQQAATALARMKATMTDDTLALTVGDLLVGRWTRASRATNRRPTDDVEQA